MKRIFFALLILSSSTVFAQQRHDDNHQENNNNVPAPVQQSFQKDNPQANNPQWQQDQNNNNRWHATYRDNNDRNTDSYYDQDGTRIETHITLGKKDIPVNIDAKVNSRYNDNGDYRAERIESSNYQPIYRIHYHRRNKEKIVYMDEHGKRRHYHGQY
jgi:hypothetical protein